MKSKSIPVPVIEKMKKFLYAEHVRTPLTVSFDITRRCNLNCRHCYNKNQAQLDYLASVENVKLIADKLLAMQVYEITLSGGEPLLSPYFINFINACKERKLCIRIITNGTLMDEYYLLLSDLLTDNDTVQFSIDESLHNMNGQRYSSLKQKQRAYSNLANLANMFKNVVVNITPTHVNQFDIPHIVRDVVNCGVEYISATPYIPIGGIVADSLVPDYDLLWKIENEVSSYCKKNNVLYFGGISGHPCQQVFNPSETMSIQEIPTLKINRHCDAGYFNFHISNDGRIFPCVFMQFDDFLISHIRYDAKKILDDFKAFQMLENISLPHKCSACNRLNDCFGGCIGLIYDRYKSLENVDPRCVY